MRNTRELMKSEQLFRLGDADGVSPLEAAIQEAADELAKLEELRDHAHEWDARGFCAFCGWDGNA